MDRVSPGKRPAGRVPLDDGAKCRRVVADLARIDTKIFLLSEALRRLALQSRAGKRARDKN